ncbi:MAG: protein kinase [Anaerolineae bacterium]|nr:protein kinase [Anaerolineae bacterium]
MSLVGSTLGKYQVLSELGRGGMAIVYQGYNPALQRTVALKVLPDRLAVDRDFVERFKREAQTAAQLKHPNIVTIYDVEHEGETPFIVMEYLRGHTLQHELEGKGPLPLKRIVEIVRALGSALDYAHSQGLTHRDVKPSNVMIDPEGHVTLMDFGIVKAAADRVQLTTEGVQIGTPEYMSPEQIEGRPVDPRSDIYSLGVVLFQMLTGRVPFQGPSLHQVLYSHVHQEPPPLSRFVPGLPETVDKIVLRALAKQADQRFQTAGQLAAVLTQAAIDGVSVAHARPARAKLKLVSPDGSEYPLVGIVGIGRGPQNAIYIADKRISRQHAQVRCDDAFCQISDLGSVNGTFVNDDRLRPSTPCTLTPGDRVRFGPGVTFVVAPGTAAEPLRTPRRRTSFTTTLRERIRTDRRSRALALLGGSITLILLVLCVALVIVNDSARSAQLTIVNSTGQDIQIEIGNREWHIEANQYRPIRFRPGEYDYIITLQDETTLEQHANWHVGDNGQLQIFAGGD